MLCCIWGNLEQSMARVGGSFCGSLGENTTGVQAEVVALNCYTESTEKRVGVFLFCFL